MRRSDRTTEGPPRTLSLGFWQACIACLPACFPVDALVQPGSMIIRGWDRPGVKNFQVFLRKDPGRGSLETPVNLGLSLNCQGSR